MNIIQLGYGNIHGLRLMAYFPKLIIIMIDAEPDQQEIKVKFIFWIWIRISLVAVVLEFK